MCLAASVSSRVIVHCGGPQLVSDAVAVSLCTVAVLNWSVSDYVPVSLCIVAVLNWSVTL